MHRKNEDWPLGPDSMEWSEIPVTDRGLSAESINSGVSKDSNRHTQVSDKCRVASDVSIPRRKNIKILENRLLVPPLIQSVPRKSEPLTNNNEWLVKKNKKSRAAKAKILSLNTLDSGYSAITPILNRNNLVKTKTNIKKNPNISKFKPKAIKNAVVTGKLGGATYAQILNKAKQSVSLASLGIHDLRMRRAMNGALVMELPGPDGKQLAGALRSSLEAVLGEDAAVSNPVAIRLERFG